MNKLKMKHLVALSVAAITPMAASATDLTDITGGDPFYYTSDQYLAADNKESTFMGIGRPDKTHSQVPHLPVYNGYMNTNYTYRFVNIVEQVFTMIGEGKHGLWRVQENGTVRLYKKKDAEGLAQDADVLATQNLKVIEQDYDYYLPKESWSGYKYPDQKVDDTGHLNFVDLPISHAYFDKEYQDHEPIDLPNWYCTMSGNDYPYAKKAMDFAYSQPGANQIGPLGKRAGLDVKENFRNVLRLEHLPDARSWVNTGQPGEDKLHVKWQAIDTSKTNAEYYLVERTFFNRPYLFLTAVYDNVDNPDHRYVRPAGAYYDSVKQNHTDLKTEVTYQPRFHLEGGGMTKPVGLPLYGVHHPNRAAFNAGGACPLKGGDWGRYPDVAGGSGWPTNYEEVTPLCDSVLIDIKFFTNLDGRSWNNPNKYLANAGVGTETVQYHIQPGEYGQFTDPYNTGRGAKNPDSQVVPEELTVTFPAVEPAVTYVAPKQATIASSSGMVPSAMSVCRPVINTALVSGVTK